MANGTTKSIVRGLGAGVATASAAAALGYYFYGSDKAKKHRKLAAAWATSLKREVVKETKRLREVSPEIFASVVDQAVQTYRDARGIDATELERAARELKQNWKQVQREAVIKRKRRSAAAKRASVRTSRKGSRGA